jgi:tetratricopeptide (TPR) repeat protein
MPAVSDRALKRLQKTVAECAAAHGEEDDSTILAMEAVADARRSRKEFSDVKEIDLKIITALRHRSISDDDPRMFRAVLRYSVTLGDLRLMDDACSLASQVVEAAERQYGVDSETAHLARRNQGVNLRRLGRYEELNELMKRSLRSRERNFGEHHVETARALHVLAHDSALSYDFATAVELGRRAVAIFEQSCGSDDSETLLAMNNLALHLAECGLTAEANDLIGKAAKIARRRLPSKDELRDRIENNAVLIRTSFGHSGRELPP